MTSVPIVNLPNLYLNGLQVSVVDDENLTIASGQCRDSTDSYDIVIEDDINLDVTADGVNGLDTGSIAANTWYYVYVISDPTQNYVPATLLSLSATSPWMPYGYGAFRLIGVANTDGSSDLEVIYVAGNSNTKFHLWDQTPQVLNAGTDTSLTAVDVSSGVPPFDNTPVLLQVSVTPTAAGTGVAVAPYGSTSTVLPTLNGAVAAVAALGQLTTIAKLNAGDATILYKNTNAASSSLWVTGFSISF